MRRPMVKKGSGVHEAYVRFRLPEEDKALFEAAAAKLRISLSAFLRMAALEKVERDKERAKGSGERSR
jgi:uncharacterized protein (DUF1778 family)